MSDLDKFMRGFNQGPSLSELILYGLNRRDERHARIKAEEEAAAEEQARWDLLQAGLGTDDTQLMGFSIPSEKMSVRPGMEQDYPDAEPTYQTRHTEATPESRRQALNTYREAGGDVGVAQNAINMWGGPSSMIDAPPEVKPADTYTQAQADLIASLVRGPSDQDPSMFSPEDVIASLEAMGMDPAEFEAEMKMLFEQRPDLLNDMVYPPEAPVEPRMNYSGGPSTGIYGFDENTGEGGWILGPPPPNYRGGSGSGSPTSGRTPQAPLALPDLRDYGWGPENTGPPARDAIMSQEDITEILGPFEEWYMDNIGQLPFPDTVTTQTDKERWAKRYYQRLGGIVPDETGSTGPYRNISEVPPALYDQILQDMGYVAPVSDDPTTLAIDETVQEVKPNNQNWTQLNEEVLRRANSGQTDSDTSVNVDAWLQPILAMLNDGTTTIDEVLDMIDQWIATDAMTAEEANKIIDQLP